MRLRVNAAYHADMKSWDIFISIEHFISRKKLSEFHFFSHPDRTLLATKINYKKYEPVKIFIGSNPDQGIFICQFCENTNFIRVLKVRS